MAAAAAAAQRNSQLAEAAARHMLPLPSDCLPALAGRQAAMVTAASTTEGPSAGLAAGAGTDPVVAADHQPWRQREVRRQQQQQQCDSGEGAGANAGYSPAVLPYPPPPAVQQQQPAMQRDTSAASAPAGAQEGQERCLEEGAGPPEGAQLAPQRPALYPPCTPIASSHPWPHAPHLPPPPVASGVPLPLPPAPLLASASEAWQAVSASLRTWISSSLMLMLALAMSGPGAEVSVLEVPQAVRDAVRTPGLEGLPRIASGEDVRAGRIPGLAALRGLTGLRVVRLHGLQSGGQLRAALGHLGRLPQLQMLSLGFQVREQVGRCVQVRCAERVCGWVQSGAKGKVGLVVLWECACACGCGLTAVKHLQRFLHACGAFGRLRGLVASRSTHCFRQPSCPLPLHVPLGPSSTVGYVAMAPACSS